MLIFFFCMFQYCLHLLAVCCVCQLVLHRNEQSLMPESGVNSVWSRDGLLLPKRRTEAEALLLHSSAAQAQVALHTVSFGSLMKYFSFF